MYNREPAAHAEEKFAKARISADLRHEHYAMKNNSALLTMWITASPAWGCAVITGFIFIAAMKSIAAAGNIIKFF